jgi:hypothetical protein
VIVKPESELELAACQAFMQLHGGVSPSADSRYLGWVEEDRLRVLVCLNGFVGKVCQMHIAMAPDYHYSPRDMLYECFRYAFHDCKRDMVLGVVNSKNVRALRYDLHLGFRELHRLPGMHDDGGALLLMGMAREECRFLNALQEDYHTVKFLTSVEHADLHSKLLQ